MSDWNDKIIAEFRAKGGQVGGQFAGAPLLLLHTVGAGPADPGEPDDVPGGGRRLRRVRLQGRRTTNPDWYHNLLAHPRVRAEIGTDTVELVARVTAGHERERIWSAQKAAYPGFADYEQQTTRQIPVVVLEPAP